MLREQALLSRSRLINVLRIDLAYPEHAHSMPLWSKVKKKCMGTRRVSSHDPRLWIVDREQGHGIQKRGTYVSCVGYFKSPRAGHSWF